MLMQVYEGCTSVFVVQRCVGWEVSEHGITANLLMINNSYIVDVQ